MAEAGARKASFSELNTLGRKAEARMFRATQGRNTHRGAIFTLGLLAAGAGFAARYGEPRADVVCRAVPELWAAEIHAAASEPQAPSHGSAVRQHFGVTGAREEAVDGFPTLDVGLMALRKARRAGADRNDAALQALFAIMAILPDNNLLYRGGAEGLAFAQQAARSFLARGGVLATDGYARALSLHRRFVEANLSPGGAADLLAATLFVDAFERYGEQL